MSKLTNAVRRFVRDEEGATTAEYGVIVLVMVTIAIAVLWTFRDDLSNLYNDAGTTMDNAGTPPAAT